MGKCISNQIPPLPKLIHNKISSDLIQEIESCKTPFFNLSKSDRKLISKSLKTHYLFSSLLESDMEDLYSNLQAFNLNKNEVIFRQGDPGKRFYIIASGEVEVIRDNVKKKVLSAGDNFGDMSLVTQAPRRATLITLKETKLWGMSRLDFNLALKKVYSRNYDENRSFISKLQIFCEFSETSKDLLTRSSIQHSYADNYRILCEGDPGTMLFILKSGEAIAKLSNIEKFRIKPGEIFGESVVFSQDTKINYSVHSVGQVECLSIDKESLISCLGVDYKEIIYRTIVKHSISADATLKMIPEENLQGILKEMKWIQCQPLDVVCDPDSSNSVVFCICFGKFAAGEQVFEMNESFGLGNKNMKIVRKYGLVCESEGVIGYASSEVIEQVVKMPCKELKLQLKVAQFLRSIDFLSSLPLAKLKYLSSKVSLNEYDPRELIFEEHQKSSSFFVVRKGKVEIFEKGKKTRVLSQLEHFGESCFREKRRKNLARTVTSCELIEIPAKAYLNLTEPEKLQKMNSRKSLLAIFELNQVLKISKIKSKSFETILKASLGEEEAIFYVVVLNTKKIGSIKTCREIVRIKQIAVNTEHPLMPKYLKSFVDETFVYIFYEYQNEFPFTSIPKGTFNEDYTKFIAACLISILEYLHSKDIAYRGLNPHYIALKPSGYPVLTSYSPAVIIKPGIFSLSMPQLGVYSAPELSDQKYSKAVDLWSLGIIIYQCLYGTLPFELKENDSFETIYSKTNAKRLIFPNNTNFFKAEELLNVLLSTDPKLRTTVKDIKYMKWFSSIDWQRISLETYSAAFIPSFKEEKKKKTLVSLKKYMHEKFDDSSEYKIKFNWKQYF